MINLLGWIGNIGFLLGAVMLAKHKISGWYWQILGNLLYAIVAYLTNISSLVILSIILIIINIYGALKWINIEN